MAHNKVFGICESKCRVEVPTKESFDNVIEQIGNDINVALNGKANDGHNHDNRYSLLNHNHNNTYYLKSEVYSKSQTDKVIETKLDSHLLTKRYQTGNVTITGYEQKSVNVVIDLAGYTPLIAVPDNIGQVKVGITIGANQSHQKVATVWLQGITESGVQNGAVAFTVLYCKDN